MRRSSKTRLGSFEDPSEADKCVREHALRIKRLKVANQFSVGIETAEEWHHVYLYERNQ